MNGVKVLKVVERDKGKKKQREFGDMNQVHSLLRNRWCKCNREKKKENISSKSQYNLVISFTINKVMEGDIYHFIFLL